jgi:hypothetical protein
MVVCQAHAQIDTDYLLPDGQREPSALNVSIALFDPGIPQDRSVHRDQQVYPRIREIEALFLPFRLREVLNDSHEWGVVRVVPQVDDSAELLVTASIVHSDGELLELSVRAADSAGRIWVDQVYTGSSDANYARNEEDPAAREPRAMYAQIASDLLLARDQLDERKLREVAELSLLRYANGLVPEKFGDYIGTTEAGGYELLRLPAATDPMLGRIHRLRRVENTITDTVDERYEELHEEIASVYDLWREYRRRYSRFQVEEAERAANDPSDAPRGSYESMMDRYQQYKWDRAAAQEQDDWAVGFDNEVGPTISRIESRIEKLEGWVEQEYSVWERILAEFYELEELEEG